MHYPESRPPRTRKNPHAVFLRSLKYVETFLSNRGVRLDDLCDSYWMSVPTPTIHELYVQQEASFFSVVIISINMSLSEKCTCSTSFFLVISTIVLRVLKQLSLTPPPPPLITCSQNCLFPIDAHYLITLSIVAVWLFHFSESQGKITLILNNSRRSS